MAQKAYRSLEPGEQIIITDDERPDLEELARWESIDVSKAKSILKRQAEEADAEAAKTAPPVTAPNPTAEAGQKAADEASAKAAADAAAKAAETSAKAPAK